MLVAVMFFILYRTPNSPVHEQFGESQKLRLVRILRSTVMVRVGGGWVGLDEFLVKNDPCRGRTQFAYIMQNKRVIKYIISIIRILFANANRI